MAATQTITTAQQLLQAEGLGRCELVRGELAMMSPAGFEHGATVTAISLPLAGFVKEHSLGIVTGAETGFHIGSDPDTVRAPDVAFIRSSRIPPRPVRGFFPGAPDLAVEVVSPTDRASELLAKVQDWLAAGCLAVWVVDPLERTVAVCRPDKPLATLRPADVLEGDDVVPGFSVPVAALFAS